MRVLLSGHGAMGQLVEEIIASTERCTVVGTVDSRTMGQCSTIGRADVVIDFSHPAMLPQLSAYLCRTGAALCCGTTGFGPREQDLLDTLALEVPILYSANFSLGVAVLRQAISSVAPFLRAQFDLELLETHHRRKMDAPSGTAKLLLETLDPQHTMTPIYGREGMGGPRGPQEIGLLSMRGGTVAGEHTLFCFGEDEHLSFQHTATDRRIFARGAVEAARRLAGKKPGRYQLEELLFPALRT